MPLMPQVTSYVTAGPWAVCNGDSSTLCTLWAASGSQINYLLFLNSDSSSEVVAYQWNARALLIETNQMVERSGVAARNPGDKTGSGVSSIIVLNFGGKVREITWSVLELAPVSVHASHHTIKGGNQND